MRRWQRDRPPWLGLAAVVATTTALVGCADEDDGFTAGLKGTLDLELRDSATIEISQTDKDGGTTVRLTLGQGYGLAPAGETLAAEGRIERWSEARSTLYTARFAARAQSDGPCGDEPLSLALSLNRQHDNEMVVGGLAAYCGEARWHGTPVRILRLSGALPP